MKTVEIPDPDDSWAAVELYRWQHGCLPNHPGHEEKPLDEVAGLRAMATAIERGDVNNFPSPMNVVSVLNYAAKLIERGRVFRNNVLEEAVNAAKNCLRECPTPQQDELMSDVVNSIQHLKSD